MPFGVRRNRQFPAGARAIVERRHRAFGHDAFDAALDRLVMQPERPSYRKRRVFPIGQNIRARSTRIAGSVAIG
jgi:hypothetical protein